MQARWRGALAATVLIAGCAGPTVTPAGSTGSATMSAAPTTIPTAVTSCAQQALTALSLQQRIGQLFLLGLADDQLGPAELSAIRDQHVGSVWFTATTSIGAAGVRAIADAVQAEATSTATGGVRFFVAANQEGGLIQALRGPGFSTIPSALTQGGLSTGVLMADAQRWGQELSAAGVNLNFAPVFDVVPPNADAINQPVGALQREYGHDPLTAGSHAVAFVAGMTEAGVATTAKHFPGLGRVVGNTDFSAGVVDEVTSADDPYLASFRAAVGAHVSFVMVALATYTRIDPAHLAAFSPTIIGQLLRGDLGFRGAVISDDLAATEAVSNVAPGQRALDFLLAGGDFIVSKTVEATKAMVEALQARATSDPSFVGRLNDAALRVLEAKQSAGLLPC